MYSHDGGNFRDVRNSNVLIYWPHGFGDWIHLAAVLPFLETSNRYWITRYGDDNVSIFDSHESVTPVYLGFNSTQCDDGGDFLNKHFGIQYEHVNGGELELRLPIALHDCCKQNDIRTVLWSSYPEVWGDAPYPFHTKARNLLRLLAPESRLRDSSLDQRLPSSINFRASPWLVQWVESRLQNAFGNTGGRLCIVGRNGYTAVGKNWGHMWREDLPRECAREGEECRDFMRLMLRNDPRWNFLVIEDRLFTGDDTVRSRELHAVSYAEVFGISGASSIPFGLILKVVLSFAELFIGVPAGPYHLAMVTPDLPVVGLWIEHLPSWYDEPKDISIHVISRNIQDKQLDKRPGSFASRDRLSYRTMAVGSRIISGECAFEAAQALL
ncbi:hypothetical protein AB3X96_35540 [Paraburkholderia sp. BR13439]|uniref:hypothetical protein n=1 Tax=Paraburkholderia sp. BR13439 TaxID=3236996 RepID=UPI0034CFFA43